MPLITKKPPKTVGTLAKAAVRDAFSPSTLGGRANASVTATPTLSEPHPVYNLGLDEVVKGDKANLKAARQTGWRYLVVHGTDVVAATEVHQSSARGVATFSNISEGSFAEGSGAAIAAAKDLPGLEAHDFELRLLRIPALYVMALWLHSPNKELLIPLDSGAAVGGGHANATTGGLAVDEQYTPSEFFRRLKPQADVLAAYDSQQQLSGPSGGSARKKMIVKHVPTRRKSAKPSVAKRSSPVPAMDKVKKAAAVQKSLAAVKKAAKRN